MLLIPLFAADTPVPLFHGLCAARFVLLREEGLLVGRDLREVMTALLDHLCHADEAVADLVLTLRQRRAAFHRSTEIDAVALVGGRCSGSVRREQHLLAAVLTALSGFGQCAGHMINSGGKSYTCHVVRAILVSATKLRFMGSYSDALTLRSARTSLAYVPRGEPSKLDERG